MFYFLLTGTFVRSIIYANKGSMQEKRGQKMENSNELRGFSRLEVLVCSLVSIAISFGPLLFLY